jgi:N-acetylmuramic acid 6-phosphate etherase
MQATTIELCVMLTVLEMVVRELVLPSELTATKEASAAVPGEFLAQLMEMHATLKSPEVLEPLAKIVALEESVYHTGHKNNYYADRLGIDVLTDTTERSPTFCTPPFRKFDDDKATDSWAFLFLPKPETPQAWESILKREPRCVEWSESEVRGLVDADKFARTHDIVRKISRAELMRFKIGRDGFKYRGMRANDSAVAVLSENEDERLWESFLSATRVPSTRGAFIYFGERETFGAFRQTMVKQSTELLPVFVACPARTLFLDGVRRAGVKMLLNALSTCTMVRLGRVMGNCMIWVVASNLKLIDRATRYIQKLSGLAYDDANRLLFEVVEYIEPRMKADQAYPPVVGMAVLRAKHQLTNEQAEEKLKSELSLANPGR